MSDSHQNFDISGAENGSEFLSFYIPALIFHIMRKKFGQKLYEQYRDADFKATAKRVPSWGGNDETSAFLVIKSFERQVLSCSTPEEIIKFAEEQDVHFVAVELEDMKKEAAMQMEISPSIKKNH